MRKKISHIISSIILYIFAGLLFIYTVWSFTHCADIISQAKAAGQLATSGNEYDIASFYMGNCGQYFVLTLLLAATGLLLQKEQSVASESNVAVQSANNEADDEELDDLFNEMESTDSAKSKDE